MWDDRVHPEFFVRLRGRNNPIWNVEMGILELKNHRAAAKGTVESTSCTRGETSPEPIVLELWRSSPPVSRWGSTSLNVATVGSSVDFTDGSERMKMQLKFSFVLFGIDQPQLVCNYLGPLCYIRAIVPCWSRASCSTFTHDIRKEQNTSQKALSCYGGLKAWSFGCREFTWPHTGSIFMQTYSFQETLWTDSWETTSVTATVKSPHGLVSGMTFAN